jgi:3-hydroxybutyryl-CoA dehydratase
MSGLDELLLVVGAELPARVLGPLTLTDTVRFAGACGDFNPLHHDVAAARQSGFDAPIAMGQMAAGMAGAWLADWCGIERMRHLEVRFAAPVSVGDTVTFTGSITKIDDTGEGPVAHIEFTAARGEAVVVQGSSSFVLAAPA